MQKVIGSSRYDGFGSRMIALLNARYLAEIYQLPFRFGWIALETGFHSVPPAEEVFDPDFLARYGLGASAGRFFHTNKALDLDVAAIDGALSDAGLAGIMVEACEGPLTIHGVVPPPETFSRLWDELGFSSRIRDVMASAKASIPSDAVAIHCRRGDIVHGGDRFNLYNRKFVPLALYKEAIQRELDEEASIVLLGDDQSVLGILASDIPRQNLLSSAHLYDNGFDRAVFDFTLMSSCRKIIGSESMFSVLAGLVGQVPQVSPTDMMPKRQQLDLIASDLRQKPEHYAPLERAKELQWAALVLKDEIDQCERDSLLAEASELDRDNLTYAYIRARDRVERGASRDAEILLGDTVRALLAHASGAPGWRQVKKILDRWLLDAPESFRQYLSTDLVFESVLQAVDPSSMNGNTPEMEKAICSSFAQECLRLIALDKLDEERWERERIERGGQTKVLWAWHP